MSRKTVADHQPSPEQIQSARNVLADLRAKLLEEDPSMAEDHRLMLDTLDGEGGSAIDILRAVLDAGMEARTAAAAMKLREASVKGRRERHEARAERLFGTVHRALAELKLPAIETEEVRLSVRAGVKRVEIVDAAALPAGFLKQADPEPDRKAIADAFRAGLTVAGADWVDGPETYSVKVT